MRGIFKIIVQLPGLLLDIIGLIGVLDDADKLQGTFAIFKGWFDNPYFYVSAFVFGTVWLTVTLGSLYANYKIKRAGGNVNREYPAQFRSWDRVREFTVWQVAWLWNDLEPQPSDQKTEGTPAYPTFRMLKEDLNAGMIPKASKHEGSWIWATLDRQRLIDYALSKGERPKFLFKESRYPRLIRTLLKLFGNEVPWDSHRQYDSFSTMRSYWMQAAQELGYENPYEDSWHAMQHYFESGQWEAIGRPKRENLAFHYEKIPAWKWEHIQQGFNDLRWADEDYADVRVRKAHAN